MTDRFIPPSVGSLRPFVDAGVLGLSGPPTITGTGRARDGRPTQLLAVEPFAVDRESVDAGVRVDLAVI